MDYLKKNSSAHEDLGLLAVMEALEDKEQITQRELAQTTGLTLKKVHYCLHKLLEKGYVKFQRARRNPDKRSYIYILTPAGIQAKSQLTYSFLKVTFNFYNKVEKKMLQCLQAMQSVGVKRILLYGVSDVSRIFIDMPALAKLQVVGILDDTYDGEEFHGVRILRESEFYSVDWDGILITQFEKGLEKSEAHLLNLKVPEDRIWKL